MLLKRSGYKGQYVKYPKHWRKRMRDSAGSRYQTGCDMVVGRCACGRNHTKDDWAGELHHYEDRVETYAEWATRCNRP